MRFYAVMADKAGSERVLVRQGFSWGAFFFGPAWLLWHGLWRSLLIALVMAGLAVLIFPLLFGGFPLPPPFLAALCFGFFGNQARQWECSYRGLTAVHFLAAANAGDGLHRLFALRTLAKSPPTPS